MYVGPDMGSWVVEKGLTLCRLAALAPSAAFEKSST